MSSSDIKSTSTKTLRNLIQILHDGQMGFRHAAENVKDSQLKEMFDRYSLQRSKFAGELETELRSLGEKDPQKEGTTFSGKVHRGWIELKGAFTNSDNHAVLAEAERGEDVAKKAYKDALEEENITASLRSTLSRQAGEVQQAHDKVKALRDATKKT